MVPTSHTTKSMAPHEIIVPDKGELDSMSTDKLFESFTERTGIRVLRASKEGVLRDYNVETDFPEVLGAMLATVYGASITAIADFTEKEDPVVWIRAGEFHVAIVSASDSILAAFSADGKEIPLEDLKGLAKKIDERD